jgi:hypothetical protein
MPSSIERHGRAYRRIVGVSLAVSAAIHAAVLGLARVHVEMPGEQADQPRDTPAAEQVRGMQVVVLESVAPPAPAQEARAQTQQAAAGPGDAAPTEAFATVASEAADADAAPSALPAIELRAAPTQSVAAQLDTEGRVIAAGEVRATVPDVDVGGGEDDEDEDENGGGLKGIIGGIGGFLGGIKVSGGIGGGGGSGGKGGCVPGIGGITGGRPKTPNIPQRPAVGPPGIGGRGPGPMRFEHRSGTGEGGGGCSSGR